MSVVQFRPWAPSVLRSSALHHVAALRRVVALDGFDEDTFCYRHRPALRSPLSVHLMALCAGRRIEHDEHYNRGKGPCSIEERAMSKHAKPDC